MDTFSLTTDQDLLVMFTEMIRADHYDPHETPANVKALRETGITQHDLSDEILRRMNK